MYGLFDLFGDIGGIKDILIAIFTFFFGKFIAFNSKIAIISSLYHSEFLHEYSQQNGTVKEENESSNE